MSNVPHAEPKPQGSAPIDLLVGVSVQVSDEMHRVYDAMVAVEVALRSSPDDEDEIRALQRTLVEAKSRLLAARAALDAARAAAKLAGGWS